MLIRRTKLSVRDGRRIRTRHLGEIVRHARGAMIHPYLLQRIGKLTIASLIMLVPIVSLDGARASTKVEEIKSWKELKSSEQLAPNQGPQYFSFPLENGTKAHLVVVNTADKRWRIAPFITDKTQPVSEAAAAANATVAINGGYFNLSDGISASYVYIDGKQIADPHTNKALINNPKLQPHLAKIFDRTEIRFLTNNQTGQELIQIARHSEPVASGFKLRDSLQAGPRLLPELTSEEEAFVRTEPDGSVSDSIGTKRLAARTAFGTTDDGYAMFLTVAGKGQEDGSSGLSLTGLAQLLKHLGCSHAINLDGGASTTMCVRKCTNGSEGKLVTVCGKTPETRVKTSLVLRPM